MIETTAPLSESLNAPIRCATDAVAGQGRAAASSDTLNCPPNFDRLARLYRWMEYLSFGPWLWRCRVHFLPKLAHCRSALVLGDGDGRFTARLLRANPCIRVTALDASPRMIASLQSACKPHRKRLETQVADILDWPPPESACYDVIVTHFLLDCLTTEEVYALAVRLAPFIAPGALWLVSEFNIPGTVFGRLVAAPIVQLLYRAFRVLTGLRVLALPDHAQALRASGWTLCDQASNLKRLLTSQLWRRDAESG